MSLFFSARIDPRQHEVDDLDDLVLGQLVEHDDVVDTVEELGTEVLLELVLDLGLHPVVVDRRPPPVVKPIPGPLEMSRVPRFDVMMITVFLKST